MNTQHLIKHTTYFYQHALNPATIILARHPNLCPAPCDCDEGAWYWRPAALLHYACDIQLSWLLHLLFIRRVYLGCFHLHCNALPERARASLSQRGLHKQDLHVIKSKNCLWVMFCLVALYSRYVPYLHNFNMNKSY